MFSRFVVFEAEQIGKAILNAAKDAKTFQKAQSEWARSQMQRLNCEIKGSQNNGATDST